MGTARHSFDEKAIKVFFSPGSKGEQGIHTTNQLDLIDSDPVIKQILFNMIITWSSRARMTKSIGQESNSRLSSKRTFTT
ncbi:hypothetical protein E4T56_gene19521 [Termitomyces sp. T112]|nr:hypothetical protein E4T56_gene19521 [Termitomyces sp. T112]